MSGRRALLFAFVFAACSGGRDKHLADLQSTRPELRAQAVKALAEKADADDVSLFSQAARDPSPIVRAEAMTALGKSQDSRVVDLLGEALTDADELVQQRAAAALASLKTDKARGYLTLQYSRRGRSTRQAIVEALKGTHIPGAMASVVAAESATIQERYVKVLNDGTLPEQVAAAEELGRSGRPDAVNRLVPLLKDKHVSLAAAAARGLGLAGDARAVPALMPLLDENYPELREAACEALGRLKDPAPVPKLVDIAREKSPASAVAVRSLLQLPSSAPVDAALCGLLLTATEAEVANIGRELRRRGGCPLEPLTDKLKSPATVNQALLALIALGPQSELAAKVIPLSSSPDAATRRLAVELLAGQQEAGVAEAVRKAWDAEMKSLEPRRADWISSPLPQEYANGFEPGKAVDPDNPMHVIKAKSSDLLARVAQLDAQRAAAAGKTLLKPRVPREIIDDAEDSELETLATILIAMGRLNLPGTKEAALPFTEETNPQLRGAGYATLALLGEDARVGLFDTERSVQSATASALVEQGAKGQLVVLQAMSELPGDRSRLIEPLRSVKPPPEGVPMLEALVKEGGLEAGTAARLLGEMGSVSSLPVLLQVLNDAEAVARSQVLDAVGVLGDPQGADTVAKYLYSESPHLRAQACRALAKLKSTSQLEALDALKGDYDRSVRESAQAALDALSRTAGTPDGGTR